MPGLQASPQDLNLPATKPAEGPPVASVGLVVNLVSMKLLSAGSSEPQRPRCLFRSLERHAGIAGRDRCGFGYHVPGWTLADPIIGAGIGLFIVPRTWSLLKQAVHILMEGVPAEVDLGELEKALLEIPGVIAVHGLHVWMITSGVDSLAGHLVVGEMKDRPRS